MYIRMKTFGYTHPQGFEYNLFQKNYLGMKEVISSPQAIFFFFWVPKKCGSSHFLCTLSFNILGNFIK